MSPTWRPAVRRRRLAERAELNAQIRSFFAERGVLEVETPLLSAATVTDLHLASFAVPTEEGARRYLQTSPEFAMKRLVAAGSGPVYQLGRAFRQGESGRFHNPEFTLLEWYRPGWNHHELMDEMDAFLGVVLSSERAERSTYAEVFERYVQIDPHRASVEDLERAAAVFDVVGLDGADRDTWLHLLMSHGVEPHLGQDRPVFVHDFPATQAALARVRLEETPLAERFEVYFRGVELANGFHELRDAVEQRRRFEDDLTKRRDAGLPEPPIDERLLAALDHFPDCAGVALGVDRLMMLGSGAAHIDEVLAFPYELA